jgi:hypothetical protein
VRAKLLLLAALLAAPALAGNYIALTLQPGSGGLVMTYTYNVALTAGPVSVTKADVVTVANVPLTTSIDISQTPTLIWPVELEGTIEVTAVDSSGNTATGAQSFTMTLQPGQTNTLDINVTLSNGGSVSGQVVLYVAKLSIPFAGLAAVGLAGLLGRRLRRK